MMEVTRKVTSLLQELKAAAPSSGTHITVEIINGVGYLHTGQEQKDIEEVMKSWTNH